MNADKTKALVLIRVDRRSSAANNILMRSLKLTSMVASTAAGLPTFIPGWNLQRLMSSMAFSFKLNGGAFLNGIVLPPRGPIVCLYTPSLAACTGLQGERRRRLR
jgi:hypothetical protein